MLFFACIFSGLKTVKEAAPPMGVSGGKAQAAAFHADLQTVCRLAARVDDAAVHVTGQVAVATFL